MKTRNIYSALCTTFVAGLVLVDVLGPAAGVHPFEPFHDPALSINAPDRPRTAGLYCTEQRTSGLYVLLQCDFSADGNQPQPQCEAAAGKPVSFDAAAAV